MMLNEDIKTISEANNIMDTRYKDLCRKYNDNSLNNLEANELNIIENRGLKEWFECCVSFRDTDGNIFIKKFENLINN